MDALWAPWRLEFIKMEREQEKGCIFCRFPAEPNDEGNLVLGRSPKSFVMLNKFPYNNGHVMVIPRRHGPDLAALPEDEFVDLHRLLRVSVEVLSGAYQPHGFNIGMNQGRAAGAGILDHVHYHVVPRWDGDTNCMPVLADTKVMIEHLKASYQRLRAPFDRRLASSSP